MAMLEADGHESTQLTFEDFGPNGELTTKAAELALVIQSFQKASEWVAGKQWNLLWRDADILYAAPRPQTAFEGSGVAEPAVVRWTVAKTIQSVVPKLVGGLFYDNPPLQMRPRPGTSQDTIRAKEALFSYLLDQCEFRTETELAMEQFALLGTTIVKWGYRRCEETVKTRKPSQAHIPGAAGQKTTVIVDEEPKLEEKKVTRTYPTFEFCDLRRVFVDPKCERGDIRFADYVVHQSYMDYYQIKALMSDPEWDIPADVLEVWRGPAETGETAPGSTSVEQMTSVQAIVHHSMDENLQSSPDPLRKKLEVLEFWDTERVVAVLNRKVVIRSKANKLKKVPFLSANWWNRPKSFYGIGLGMITGQDQRVQAGIANAILKILSFKANPPYLRKRDGTLANQMIRTGLGRIITVDGDADKAFRLLETPNVDGNMWQAIKESQQASEEASGADAMLVQGNTAGGRTSMGRTAGGAGILSDAADSRLEGPLNRYINQIFIPFIYQLDELVKCYMTDAEIREVIGDRLGEEAKVDMSEFFGTLGCTQYEVLAGASMKARRAMSQALLTMVQFVENPQLLESMADVSGAYFDAEEFEKMVWESTGWKNFYSVWKPLTPEMKAARQAKQQSQGPSGKLQSDLAKMDHKAQIDAQQSEVDNEQRIQRDMSREAIKRTLNGSDETAGVE